MGALPTASPISLGGIATLSGRLRFPESSAAADAVFDAVNQGGGIQGRPISYRVLDDRGETARALDALEELIVDDAACVLVGGTSTAAAQVIGARLAEFDAVNVVGIGTHPACYAEPRIWSLSPSAFTGMTQGLTFLSERFDGATIALIANSHPDVPGNFSGAIADWESATGCRLTFEHQAVTDVAQFPELLDAAVAAGTESLVAGFLSYQLISLLDALHERGEQTMRVLFPAAGYSPALAETVAERFGRYFDDRVFALSLFDFVDGDTRGTRSMRSLFARTKIAPSQFAIGGYLAANAVARALDKLAQAEPHPSLSGPSFRSAVSTTLQALVFDTDGICSSPVRFGQPNPAMRVVRLVDGAWKHEPRL